MTQPTQLSFARLEEILGGAQVTADPAELAAREVCGSRPAVCVRPAEAAQIAEILRFAAAEKLAVIPTGGCTKLGIGSPPSRYDIALDLSLMNRMLAYDPQDLTLGVEPGVRIQDLLRTLAEQGQFLPLAVPFLDRGTIGGIMASNSSSPLRHTYGSARDFCLGMEFVTGEGKQAKSGGRVVKNVTGYDLHRLLIGSLGTLAVITRVNFRTFPMPQTQGTFIASFSSTEPAFEFCHAVSHSALTPQIMELADPGAAPLIFSGQASPRIEARAWSVIASAAGSPAVVERHARELGHLASAAGAEEFIRLNEFEEPVILTRVREFPRLVLEASPSASIFRIGALPGVMPSLLGKLRALAVRHRLQLVAVARASGILYAALLTGEGQSEATSSRREANADVFELCAKPEMQASAVLERCPADLKSAPDAVWGLPRLDFELMRGVKNAFDPHNVLAPGRHVGGI